jgi:hypothetical protein
VHDLEGELAAARARIDELEHAGVGMLRLTKGAIVQEIVRSSPPASFPTSSSPRSGSSSAST